MTSYDRTLNFVIKVAGASGWRPNEKHWLRQQMLAWGQAASLRGRFDLHVVSREQVLAGAIAGINVVSQQAGLDDLIRVEVVGQGLTVVCEFRLPGRSDAERVAWMQRLRSPTLYPLPSASRRRHSTRPSPPIAARKPSAPPLGCRADLVFKRIRQREVSGTLIYTDIGRPYPILVRRPADGDPVRVRSMAAGEQPLDISQVSGHEALGLLIEEAVARTSIIGQINGHVYARSTPLPNGTDPVYVIYNRKYPELMVRSGHRYRRCRLWTGVDKVDQWLYAQLLEILPHVRVVSDA